MFEATEVAQEQKAPCRDEAEEESGPEPKKAKIGVDEAGFLAGANSGVEWSAAFKERFGHAPPPTVVERLVQIYKSQQQVGYCKFETGAGPPSEIPSNDSATRDVVNAWAQAIDVVLQVFLVVQMPVSLNFSHLRRHLS